MHPNLVDGAITRLEARAGIGPQLARRLLESLQAEEVSAMQHPLGFFHFEINSTPKPGTRARLHLWTEDSLAAVDGLGLHHDHAWHLRSGVLTGRLRDTALQPVATSDGDYVGVRITYGRSGNTNRAEKITGRWALKELDRRVVGPGEVYELEPRVVHITTPLTLPLATLVLAEDRGGPGPVIFVRAESDLRTADAAPRPEAERDRVAVALERAIRSLPK